MNMSLKNNIISLGLSGLAILSGCSSNSNNINYASRFKDLESMNFKTILDARDYAIRQVKYKGDFLSPILDNWNSPKKTLELGNGDCDDNAILGAYVAEKLGYQPKILVVGKDNHSSGHIFTLLEKEDKNQQILYGGFDFGIFVEPKYSSVEDLVEYLGTMSKDKYRRYKVFDLDRLDKNWRTTRKNLRPFYILRSGFEKIKK
jgi:hypothetical protein